MRIFDLLTAIKTDVKGHITSLKACELHGGRFDRAELKRIAGRTPAIYIAALGHSRSDDPGTGERDIDLSLAAFVVTADRRGLPRIEGAINLVESLLTLIPGNRWGQSGVFGAAQAASNNFYSGDIDKQGVALWGVSWRQTLRLGQSAWDATGTLPTQVYLGLEPKIGLGHEKDYSRASTASAKGKAS